MTEFNLTRKEFADKLGITTDNLKKKMKIQFMGRIKRK